MQLVHSAVSENYFLTVSIFIISRFMFFCFISVCSILCYCEIIKLFFLKKHARRANLY